MDAGRLLDGFMAKKFELIATIFAVFCNSIKDKLINSQK